MSLMMFDDEVDDAVIDRALHFVENQSVLVALKAGKPWGKSFGIGGSSHPVRWDGSAKGIEIFHRDQRRMIRPSQILERAKQYKPVNPF